MDISTILILILYILVVLALGFSMWALLKEPGEVSDSLWRTASTIVIASLALVVVAGFIFGASLSTIAQAAGALAVFSFVLHKRKAAAEKQRNNPSNPV